MAERLAPETLETLQRVGLTEYESRAYHALLGLGRADGATVARAAGIPPTRVHEVLKALCRKAWATSEAGRPVVFIPREPGERLRAAWAGVAKAYEVARDDLQQAHAGRTMAAASPVWFIRGDDAIAQKLVDVVQAAREQVVANVAYRLPFDDDLYFPALARAARRGRRVRVVVAPALAHGNAAAPWTKLTRAGVELRVMPVPLRQTLVDFEVGVVVAPDEPGRQRIAIWNPVREVVQMLGPSFDGMWAQAEPWRAGRRRT